MNFEKHPKKSYSRPSAWLAASIWLCQTASATARALGEMSTCTAAFLEFSSH